MTTGLGVASILDPRQCWKDWIRLGSLAKIRDELQDKGVINQRTMKPPTISAIQKAAYRWALENQDEARKDLRYAWSEVGRVLTDADWRDFLADKARLAYFVQPRKLESFLEAHQLV